MILKYLEVIDGVAQEITHDIYVDNKKKLKLSFIDKIQPLSHQDFLLTYLAFRQEKLHQEDTKNGFCFFSHLEKLFQDEITLRGLNQSVVFSDNNDHPDGFSVLEKKLIKRFKLIRALTDEKLIERYVIIINREIERHHENHFKSVATEGITTRAVCDCDWIQILIEKEFIAQEFVNRRLRIPNINSLVTNNSVTFVGDFQ